MECAPVSYLFDGTSRPDPAGHAALPPRDTKTIGDRSELEVMLALVRNGYAIFLPLGENHRYDLVAERDGAFFRVQVKTGRLHGGAIRFNCFSSHAHRRGGPTAMRPYFGQIDFLAVYCPDNRKVYLMPESELVRTKGHLRLLPSRNRQRRLIRWADGFELL